MTDASLSFITQVADEVLGDWGLAEAIGGHLIAQLVAGGAAHWETTLPDGRRLALVRLLAPVAQREEVFLGNVLFNDFLSKALVRAVEGQGLGQIAPVANDLESYYYLLLPTGQFNVVLQALRQEVTESLPGLYFADEDSTRGIYGDVERMLDFRKCNVEPFPLFAMTPTGKTQVERKVRARLRALIEADDWVDNLTNILALLAFFYGKTSGGTGDTQSPPHFLRRLVTEYQLLSREELCRALNIDEETCQALDFSKKGDAKSLIYQRLKVTINRKTQERQYAFDPAGLRQLLLKFVDTFGQDIDTGAGEWLLPYVGQKFLSLDEETLAGLLLSQVQLGYQLFPSEPVDAGAVLCRVCGTLPATLEDKSILMGIATHRFHSQSAKQRSKKSEKICVRCALFSYLTVKLLGSTSVGQPQVPRQYNVIFHYGQHDETETEEIAAKLDLILRLATQFHTAGRIREELRQLEHQREAQTAKVAGDLLSTLDDPYLETSCEVLGQLVGDIETKQQVLGLGYGGYRLMFFILPQSQWRGKESHDFVQKRFSKSRVAVFTLLAFLRRLCGCDGPFYFQSLPTLAPGGFNRDTFYVRNQPISVKDALNRYEAITNFARRVVKYEQGRSRLVEWILLAERFLNDPLGTFSDVLRDTPLRREDFRPEKLKKFKYKLPSKGLSFVPGMGVINSLEHLDLFEKLSKLGGDLMIKQLDTERLNRFTEMLLHALDRLGGSRKGKTRLLPMRLREAPTAFEKYPRMLLGLVQRYGVEAGFREWESKVLRDASAYRTEEEYPELLALYRWMQDNEDLFDKAHLAYLKRSLYGRVYRYLYPRRLLATAYAQAHAGDEAAFEDQAVADGFRAAIEGELQQLGEVYSLEQLEQIVADAQAHLLDERHYYRAW